MSKSQTQIPTSEKIGIIGAGAAGLITADVFIRDGFTNIQLLTRDPSAGGIWAKHRVYPGLALNNVHGEFRFSSMEMEKPADSEKTGGRLSGELMTRYMETFAEQKLKERIRYNTEIISIRRGDGGEKWVVRVKDIHSNAEEELVFDRLVLCTGGCSNPKILPELTPEAAADVGFSGLILHSNQFGQQVGKVLESVKPMKEGENAGHIVVVGGGKSAQDIAAYLANEGRKVTIVYNTIDTFSATPKPLPDFMRKSRLMAIMSPYSEQRTRLERFLHTTWLGGKIVKSFWTNMEEDSFAAYNIPKDSPLRLTPLPFFWTTRAQDEGVCRPNGFYVLANSGAIDIIAPAHAERFVNGKLKLSNGTELSADVVILATGYTSSWDKIFDKKTAEELGIAPQTVVAHEDVWKYTSMSEPPPRRGELGSTSTSIYRGIIPAKNILRKDFAINGAILSTNNGYVFEVVAHWISSYFLEDKMRLPSSTEEALDDTARYSAWIQKRWPNIMAWASESYAGAIPFLNYPQAVDELLDDMYLPSLRSGGNWFTWPFKVVDLAEISTLGEERRSNRVNRVNHSG